MSRHRPIISGTGHIYARNTFLLLVSELRTYDAAFKRARSTRRHSVAKAKTPKKDKATPCEEGPDKDTVVWTLNIRQGQPVDFQARVCFANARIRLWIQQEPTGADLLLLDQSDASQIELRLPDLDPGTYYMRWSFLTPSDKWQTRTKVDVAGATRWLQRKRSDGDNPVNSATLGLKVSA
jgi:hypothetical protein